MIADHSHGVNRILASNIGGVMEYQNSEEWIEDLIKELEADNDSFDDDLIDAEFDEVWA